MLRSCNVVVICSASAGVVALVGAGVGVASVGSQSAHTLTFKSVQINSHNIAHTNRFINVDRDVRKGKYIGNDVFEGTLTTAGVTTILSFALKGGFIYGRTTSNFSTADGRITGGTGAYKDAKGTISVSGAQDSPTVSIVYRR